MSDALVCMLAAVVTLSLAACAHAQDTEPAGDADASEVQTTIDGPIEDPERGVTRFTARTDYLGEPSTIEVLLPDELEPGRRYRTLYVLPVEGGVGGQFGDGLMQVREADAHNRYGLICVSMSFDTVPWYGSHASDPAKRHALFIKDVVVPLIERRFPATGRAEDRLLIGFSKSGYGAVSLLLRDPAFFGGACAWDAPLMMTQEKLGWGSRHHFGTADHAAAYVPVHLVKQHAAQLTDGPARLTILGRDIFGQHVRRFHELLDAHDVTHRYDNDLAFKHHWASGWVEPALAIFLGEPPQ